MKTKLRTRKPRSISGYTLSHFLLDRCFVAVTAPHRIDERGRHVAARRPARDGALAETPPEPAMSTTNTTGAYAQIVAVFLAPKTDLRDLPEGDPLAALGQTCEALFTSGVEVLRSLVPNDRIRSIARVVWDLVDHKQVLVVLGAEVPSITFTVMQRSGVHQGLVLIPKACPELVEADPFMQLGAILFAGVQAVDFYNDRLVGDRGAHRRWQAYEAELLRTLKVGVRRWTPNVWQQEILRSCPDGLDTDGVELYAYKPYAPSKGDA